jgi:uncharacterized protein YyaL (SSP411 family)
VSNQLKNSSSPYLLQHAENPVNWFPWGKDALEKARSENKPIILSIGYSACHWCHVMEKNCFENESIAEVMNEHFISIKVDREERPDVDNLYMEALHLMGIPGGWPLNVFLSPEQLPFYGGTYFPPQQWMSILQQIAKAHTDKPLELKEIGQRNRDGLRISEHQRRFRQEDRKTLQEIIQQGMHELEKIYDARNGGFGQAPKFPMPCVYRYLFHLHTLIPGTSAGEMAMNSLEKIALGGIQDHLGGGFARYSVDSEWCIPHFEKMLYDNAQLLSLFSIAWQQSSKQIYKLAAEGIIKFITNELSHPSGGFFSALDADSEGREGSFYVWTKQEISDITGPDFEAFSRFYDLPEEGNFEDGKSVIRSLQNEAVFLQPLPEEEQTALRNALERSREKLLERRSLRIRPGLDDKIICSWNAMMISGLCDASRIFKKESYMEQAVVCANFIRNEMLQADGRLFRIWKNGQAHTEAFLDDYAQLILAFADLAETSFDDEWLYLAEQLCDYVNTRFYDAEDGLYYYAAAGSEELIARQKELSDNVIPSSNARMALALHRLSRLLYREDFMSKSVRMCEAIHPMLRGDLRYVSEWMQVWLMIQYPPPDISVYGLESKAMRIAAEELFLPGKSIREKAVNNMEASGALVCFGTQCLKPVEKAGELGEVLMTFRRDF